METPICDFAKAYAEAENVRLHMPSHKGRPAIGPERLDLTEIAGADELYRPRGIIRRSEENAAFLFGTRRTLYSAEGSSQCVRAMLFLARLRAAEKGLPCRILAGRNAHRTLIGAAALLDLEIDWLWGDPEDGLLRCRVSPEEIESRLSEKPCAAVYLTSPDYLGNRTDIRGAAAVCRRHGVPLLVDNAHGAYLKFLEKDEHPIPLGADACCDSAHKTLGGLTGTAYLHLSADAPAVFLESAEDAMALFGSTSPSYLLLQSLDRLNRTLAEDGPARIRAAVRRTAECRERLRVAGWRTVGDEPMKLTLDAKARGYTGNGLHQLLRGRGIECEFSDPDYLVMMPSADTAEEDWRRLERALLEIPARRPLTEKPPRLTPPERVCSIREALLGARRTVPVGDAVGGVLADAWAGCPPAVPIVAAGERITAEAVQCFRYYGTDAVSVLREGACRQHPDRT